MIERSTDKTYTGTCALCGNQETVVAKEDASIVEAFEEKDWIVNPETGECFCPNCCEVIQENQDALLSEFSSSANSEFGWGEDSFDEDEEWEDVHYRLHAPTVRRCLMAVGSVLAAAVAVHFIAKLIPHKKNG